MCVWRYLCSQIWQKYSQNTAIFIIATGVNLAINNYMFRPLYWPSSSCTTSCYKVTIRYKMCLLLKARSSSQNSVAWTIINSSGTDAEVLLITMFKVIQLGCNWVEDLDQCVRCPTQSQPSCVTLNMVIESTLCLFTRINVSSCYEIL